MRRIKRCLGLLLALALLFTCAPLPVLAAETPQVYTAQGVHHNSVSKDTLKAENAVRPEKTETVPLDEYLTDLEDAALELRAALKTRQEWTTVYIRSAADDPGVLVEDLWAQAVAHTGEPTEGDYIDRQYDFYYWYAEWSNDSQYNYYQIDFEVAYFTTAAQEAEMDEAVDELLHSALAVDSSMSDYDKVKLIYDWVTDNVYYDHENVNTDNLLCHSAYAALVDRTAVCQGYAALMYRLLLSVGVDNRMIYGESNGEPHEWNIVELDGLYYNVDATWDAQMNPDYEWFLLSMDSFVDHDRDSDYTSSAFTGAYPMSLLDYGADSDTTPIPNPGNGCGMSEAEVLELMLALQDDYPEGMQWTNDNSYRWNINNTTGYGCAGFAFILSDAAFGYLPSRTIYDDITIDDLRVGDILRLYNDSHSAVVLEVHSDYIVIAEGNYNYSIHWGRIIDAQDIPSDVTYFHTRYPEHTFHNGVCVECGATQDSDDEPSVEPDQWPVSGQCGDELTWTLDEDGLLTISGYGEMWHYPEDMPGWYDFKENVIDAVIEVGVTSIGDFAFWDCTALETVEIADSLTYLGERAFARCTALEKVTFYGSAPTIGDGAFYEVTADCHYPAEDRSWSDCIGNDYYGDLTWIAEGDVPSVDLVWPITGQCGDNVTWSLDENGKLTISGTGDIWAFPEEYPGFYEYADYITECVIEEGVTSIGDYTFFDIYCMTWIRIPDSVSYIGEAAFAYCYDLESVDFVGNAPEFGSNAFYDVTADCHYPAGNSTWNGVVGDGCGGNLNWMPYGSAEDAWPVTGKCGDNVTWSLTQDGLLSISGTGEMDDYPVDYPGWYNYRDILVEAVIHAGVTTIGDFAFYDCPNLETVTIHSSVEYIGISAFNNCGLTALTIPSGVKEIAAAAFKLNDFASVTIPASVGSIGEYAFAECDDLTEVRFLGAAPWLGENAFDYVWAECHYPANNSTWVPDVFRDYGVGSLTWIADGAQETPENMVASGYCGDSVTWTLDDQGLLTISGTGKMWDVTDQENVSWYAYRDRIKRAVIESGVTSIGDWTFCRCISMNEIVIPDTVTTIGYAAFSRDAGLTKIELPDSVTEIRASAFIYCENVTEMFVPANVQTIGRMAFAATGITAIAVDPANPSFVSVDGFVYDRAMTQLIAMPGAYVGHYTMPETIKSVGDYAFAHNPHLTGVTFPEGFTSISEYAFANCTGVTRIDLPASVDYLGESVFFKCFGLSNIVFRGDAPSTFGEFMFYEVSATVYYPENNSTWDAHVGNQYDGNITWIPYEVQDVEPEPEPEIPAGDLNGSGSVDSDDAIYLLYYTLFGDGLYPVTGDCDFNNDGSVNSDDAIYLLYYTLFGDALYPLN